MKAEIFNNPQLTDLIEQAGSEVITLNQNGEQKAVLLSVAMFQNLLGVCDRWKQEEVSDDQFAVITRQIFDASGYDTREKILDLVHDVKTELLVEREQRLTSRLVKDNV